MRCKHGHDHPPAPFKAATANKTRPHGPRPYHCPDCWQVHRSGTRPGNWRTYTTVEAANRAGHDHACDACFDAQQSPASR